MAPSDACQQFCFHAFFSQLRILFLAKRMNSDGIVFGGKRMGHSFYLRVGLLFCFVELRIEKKMNLLVLPELEKTYREGVCPSLSRWRTCPCGLFQNSHSIGRLRLQRNKFGKLYEINGALMGGKRPLPGQRSTIRP